MAALRLTSFLLLLFSLIAGKRHKLPVEPDQPNFIPSSHERILSHRPKHDDNSVEDGSKLAHYGLSGKRLIPTSIKYDGKADFDRVHDPSTATRYVPKIWVPPNDTDSSEESSKNETESFLTSLDKAPVSPIPLLSPIPLPRAPAAVPQWPQTQNSRPQMVYNPPMYTPQQQYRPQQTFLPQQPQQLQPQPVYRPQQPQPVFQQQPQPVYRPQQGFLQPQQPQFLPQQPPPMYQQQLPFVMQQPQLPQQPRPVFQQQPQPFVPQQPQPIHLLQPQQPQQAYLLQPQQPQQYRWPGRL